MLDDADGQLRDESGGPGGVQQGSVDLAGLERVQEEIEEVGNDGLGAFGLQEVHQVVVDARSELDEDLANDADARLGSNGRVEGQRGESVDNRIDELFVGRSGQTLGRNER
eukprot:gnl/Ergobibamus_cyprinoides/341.p3 GENE.gnl/Ergobibamus_cyprinoides/341~~gnl/Ergobibamus_cyprinoides/341.p3  ORF type:complete len:111 (-),score=31.32 gnl/Ergobibamus_cyprinoides/341:261-593(-)